MFDITINYGSATQNTLLLSFGEVLTVLSIIIGFIQFQSPIIKFRIKTQIGEMWGLYIPSVIVMSLLYWRIRFDGSSWLEEISLMLILFIVIFICMAYRPIRFNKWNAKRFGKNVEKIIKKGIEAELIELAVEDISCSVRNIILACSKYNGVEHANADKKNEEYKITPYKLEAIKLLDLLSDSLFCKVLVVHAPNTAIAFIKEIQRFELHSEERKLDKWGDTFIKQIIHQALLTENSILYREEDFKGLGFSKEFTNLVFGNYEFVRSRFNPMEGVRYILNKDCSPIIIKKYAELTQLIIEGYFISQLDIWNEPTSINVALATLTESLWTQMRKVDYLQDNEFRNSNANKIIQEVSALLENLIKLTVERSK